uniref:Uncharacterized protein n=1 Tax=Plectus sambesii TaxID=2011161 RepID=A0A914X0P4_9BILA
MMADRSISRDKVGRTAGWIIHLRHDHAFSQTDRRPAPRCSSNQRLSSSSYLLPLATRRGASAYRTDGNRLPQYDHERIFFLARSSFISTRTVVGTAVEMDVSATASVCET